MIEIDDLLASLNRRGANAAAWFSGMRSRPAGWTPPAGELEDMVILKYTPYTMLYGAGRESVTIRDEKNGAIATSASLSEVLAVLCQLGAIHRLKCAHRTFGAAEAEGCYLEAMQGRFREWFGPHSRFSHTIADLARESSVEVEVELGLTFSRQMMHGHSDAEAMELMKSLFCMVPRAQDAALSAAFGSGRVASIEEMVDRALGPKNFFAWCTLFNTGEFKACRTLMERCGP